MNNGAGGFFIGARIDFKTSEISAPSHEIDELQEQSKAIGTLNPKSLHQLLFRDGGFCNGYSAAKRLKFLS